MNKKILYIDMDGVLVDFVSGINQLDEKTKIEFDNKFDEVPGIFNLMKPMVGGIESFNILSKVYDTYILSTSPWDNPTALQDKQNWVIKYIGEGAKKRLIFSHHKNLNIGDYLIDDRIENGAGQFMGKHIQFGTTTFQNWESVLEYLL